GATWAGSLAAARRGVAVFPDETVLAAFWGVLLGAVFCLATMMLLRCTRLGTGQCACRAAPSGSAQLPRRRHRFKAIPKRILPFSAGSAGPPTSPPAAGAPACRQRFHPDFPRGRGLRDWAAAERCAPFSAWLAATLCLRASSKFKTTGSSTGAAGGC